MRKQHIAYFDFLRGIAIILVIINHCYSGDPLSGTIKDEVYLLIRQIAVCAVPIFLAESGFFMADKVLQTNKEYFSFFFKHSFRVWLPMVLWSIPLFFIKDHQNTLMSIFFLLIGGYSIYYFITLIIQYYAMQPVLRKINRNGVFFSFLITCIAVAIDNYITSVKGVHLRLFFQCSPFFMWLVYPCLGYYIKKNGREYNIAPWLTIMMISLMACIIESKWLYRINGEGLGVTKISAVVFSCSVIFLLFSDRLQKLLKEESIFFNTIVLVGEISFGIYLIHKYFVDYLLDSYVTDTLLKAFCTLILSVFFILLFKKILPQSINRWIGFR